MSERNREQRGMAFRVGFWGRRTKILGIEFDFGVENRNSFFYLIFFKIMMMWNIVRDSKVSVLYINI